jgi:hypothetical protein
MNSEAAGMTMVTMRAAGLSNTTRWPRWSVTVTPPAPAVGELSLPQAVSRAAPAVNPTPRSKDRRVTPAEWAAGGSSTSINHLPWR